MATGDSHVDLSLDPDADTHPEHLLPVSLLLVGVGGFIGTLARYGVGRALPTASRWPVGTFAVNMAGAFVLGLVLEALARRGPDVAAMRRWRLVAGVGFCGAFTTYSTLAVEVSALSRASQHALAAIYGIVTVLVGFIATAAGIGLAAARRTAVSS